MGTAELFAWGFVGGVATYVVIYVLPALKRLSRGSRPTFEPWRVAANAVLMLSLSFVGGIASLVLGNEASAPGQAIGMGIAGEVMLKALVGQLQEAELNRET